MLARRMLYTGLPATMGVVMIAVGLAQAGAAAPAIPQPSSHPQAVTTDEKIATAMAAAPAAISTNATILDNEMDAAGKPVVLREGSNDWTCFPDLASTPSNDPMCLDQAWMAWAEGLMTKTEPQITHAGLAYMLEGGSDASNTDPFATEPATGDDWVSSPAHVMLLLPDKFDQSVFGTDPESGMPYIMWAGTPYEHIMMPVAATADGG